MNRNLKLASSLMTAVSIGLASSAAYAQEAEGEVGMALPGAAAGGQRAAAAQGAADHDAVVGRLGVGYLGRRSMLVGDGGGLDPAGNPLVPSIGCPGTTVGVGGGLDACEVEAPVIGVRYWIDQMIGLDAGIGFIFTSGDTEVSPNPAVDEAGTTGFIVHAGVPLSLTSAQHFSFQIVPELNVGFASRTLSPAAPPGTVAIETDYSGFHLDVGARVGGEVHFGFIDVPQLSLQGGVGLLFEMDNVKSTFKSTPEAKVAVSHNEIRTTVGDNPWNIFIANVAALYYF